MPPDTVRPREGGSCGALPSRSGRRPVGPLTMASLPAVWLLWKSHCDICWKARCPPRGLPSLTTALSSPPALLRTCSLVHQRDSQSSTSVAPTRSPGGPGPQRPALTVPAQGPLERHWARRALEKNKGNPPFAGLPSLLPEKWNRSRAERTGRRGAGKPGQGASRRGWGGDASAVRKTAPLMGSANVHAHSKPVIGGGHGRSRLPTSTST